MKNNLLLCLMLCIWKTAISQSQIPVQAQTPAKENDHPVTISLEVDAVDVVTGGFGLGLYLNTPRHWSVGVGLSNGLIRGNTKELIFEGDNLEDLEMDFPLIVGINARYFFRPFQEGLYGEALVGNEIVRVRQGDQVHVNPNQFAVVGLGYLWMPGKRNASGFYLNPRIGANFIWNSGGERTLGGITYRIRDVFPNPSLFVGWRF